MRIIVPDVSTAYYKPLDEQQEPARLRVRDSPAHCRSCLDTIDATIVGGKDLAIAFYVFARCHGARQFA